ncbi:general amidase-B [Aspergillus terreus]|uniref:amidase n=1 Tax=Aspergillus terreus TaxID=33178 RepID=A0A5M3YWY5_ASPTE|nr:hypothetical protein ATETN484_0003081800 [Aspergillus terreus]GFF14804.1 general amidase-B [Aspergillus terreus]
MGSIDPQTIWQERVAKKQQECFDKIPTEWRISTDLTTGLQVPLSENKNDLIQADIIRKAGLLTERELEITEQYTPTGLVSALADGRLTSIEVTLAYCKRAAVVHQLVSCLTETMFAEAQARAQYLDDLRAQGRSAGPLHGLPVSIKDNFHYKGTEATIGMVSFLDDVSTENSPLVDILLKLGAVIYVKTNIPQTMMTTDSHNNVFGRTLNPWNTALGAGGSSGGEGALIALRGSPLGVGTDIGGSVRIPALCCGTYGFRPSASRIPNGGMRICNTSGMKFILSCAGPLSLDLNGIELLMESVLNAQPAVYDSTVIDVPWRKVDVKPKLRIGVVPEDPIFPLHPPVRRVLTEATRKLEAQGHRIIPLSAKECQLLAVNAVAWSIFQLDDAAVKHILSAGEPVVPAMHHIRKQGEVLRQSHSSSMPDVSGLDRLGQLALLNTKRAELREMYRKLWVRYDLDVCISPPAQSTAVAHDTFGLPPYTAFLNTLDYPSCVIPFGKVGEQDAAENFELQDGQVGPEYDFKQLEGAPCSIQVFTSTMRDEECLQMAKQIDQCLNMIVCSLSAKSPKCLFWLVTDAMLSSPAVWRDLQERVIAATGSTILVPIHDDARDQPLLMTILHREGLVSSISEDTALQICSFFSIGPSLSMELCQMIRSRIQGSPMLLLRPYTTVARVLLRCMGNQTPYYDTDLSDCASSLQTLRNAQITKAENVGSFLALGLSLVTFHRLISGVSASTICRYTLSLVRPYYYANQLSSSDSMELTCLVFMDTTQSLFRARIPVIQYQVRDPYIVDRHAGLCGPLLPLLYRVCLLAAAIRTGSGDVPSPASFDSLTEEITAWTPNISKDALERFSQEEMYLLVTQASLHRTAALLILHRLRYPFGEKDEEAEALSRTIISEITHCLALANQYPPNITLIFLVAGAEVHDTAGKRHLLSLITKIMGANFYPFVANLRMFLARAWAGRDQGTSRYLFRLFEEDPELSIPL